MRQNIVSITTLKCDANIHAFDVLRLINAGINDLPSQNFLCTMYSRAQSLTDCVGSCTTCSNSTNDRGATFCKHCGTKLTKPDIDKMIRIDALTWQGVGQRGKSFLFEHVVPAIHGNVEAVIHWDDGHSSGLIISDGVAIECACDMKLIK